MHPPDEFPSDGKKDSGCISNFLLASSMTLVTRGIHLIEDPPVIAHICHTLYLCSIICLHSYMTLSSVFQTPKWIPAIFGGLFYDVLWFLLFLSSVVILRFRRRKISRFGKKMVSSLPLRRQRTSFLTSFYVSFSFLVLIILVTLFSTWSVYDSSNNFPSCVDMVLKGLTADPVVAPVAVYFVFLDVTYKGVEESLVLVKDAILGKERISAESLLELRTGLTNTSQLLQEFDDIFSFLPLVWIVFNLSGSVMIVLFIMLKVEYAEMLSKAWKYHLFFATSLILFLLLIAFMFVRQKRISSLTGSIQEHLTTTELMFSSSSFPLLLSSVSSKLESISSFSMTVGSFISLTQLLSVTVLTTIGVTIYNLAKDYSKDFMQQLDTANVTSGNETL